MPDGSAVYALPGDPNGLPAPIPGLVWAFRIHADGTPEALPVNAPITSTHDGLLWLHFNLADGQALHWLATTDLQVPAQAMQLVLSKDSFQQLHGAEDSVYGVISDLMRDIAETSDETGYLRFAMTERILVSGRHHALCAVDVTRRALEGGRRVESAAVLLETIVENVADAIDRIADRVGKALDEIEEQILSSDKIDLRAELGRHRRTCVRLHRQLSGLRVVFHRFELKSHDQGNDNIRVLSVLTAVLLPPTLITGIFGMNTKGLPFTELDSAFILASLLMILSSVGAYLIMKRIGIVK
jgi:zinc transporter